MDYLLDTNICILHLRSRGKSILSDRLQHLDRSLVAVCSIVRAELLSGAAKSRDSIKNTNDVTTFLHLFTSLPFDDRAANEYAQIRATLEFQGSVIGGNDFLIASIALANNLTLVTHNIREFSRVPNLKWEDWEV
jgi:tRNA(fMet)-specific endonuclease VapC